MHLYFDLKKKNIFYTARNIKLKFWVECRIQMFPLHCVCCFVICISCASDFFLFFNFINYPLLIVCLTRNIVLVLLQLFEFAERLKLIVYVHIKTSKSNKFIYRLNTPYDFFFISCYIGFSWWSFQNKWLFAANILSN